MEPAAQEIGNSSSDRIKFLAKLMFGVKKFFKDYTKIFFKLRMKLYVLLLFAKRNLQKAFCDGKRWVIEVLGADKQCKEKYAIYW